jgi:hypothetical protein
MELTLLFLVLVCQQGPATDDLNQNPQAMVFFLHSPSGKLMGVSRPLFATKSKADTAKQILNWLSEVPDESGLLAIFPSFFLREVFFVDRLLVVDVRSEIIAQLSGGVSLEAQAIYSIVNSLMVHFSEVDAVWLLVDGELSDSLMGHVDIEHPLRFNLSLVQMETPQDPKSSPAASAPPPVRKP